jgi:heat shock protein HslJ
MRRRFVMILMVGVAVVALVATVTACGGDENTADDTALLEGADWQATEIPGVDSVLPAEKGTATAVFKAGQVAGSGTVNRFFGSYETGPGNTIQVSALGSTEMAGPPEAMAQEAAYLAALQKAATYTATADTLTLMDKDGAKLIAYNAVEPTPLTGTEWQATAYNNGKGALEGLAMDSTITAVFGEDGSLSGNASVNQYNTSYTISGEDQMTIAPEIITTKMAGPDEFMAQEAAYLAALPQTATYTIEGNELWLRDATGAAMAHYLAK